MHKDEKIKIKLEVCKDKASGKLSIMAHFNSTASNVFQDKDGYSWVPTVEEKDFLSKAFALIPTDSYYCSPHKTSAKSEIDIEIKTTPETKNQEEIKPPSYNKSDEDQKSTELPPIDKSEEPLTYDVTPNEINTDELVKEIDKQIDESPPKSDDEGKNDTDSNEFEKKEDDEGIIVEADSEAIEAALKKHSENDKAIIEADEQTIVDKVLSQKKKGRWSKK